MVAFLSTHAALLIPPWSLESDGVEVCATERSKETHLHGASARFQALEVGAQSSNLVHVCHVWLPSLLSRLLFLIPSVLI